MALVCKFPDSPELLGLGMAAGMGANLPQPGSDHPPESALSQTSWAHGGS